MQKVIKRNGSIKSFDVTKIEKAIIKTMKYEQGISNDSLAHTIAQEIQEQFKNKSQVTIYEIEDAVFYKLLKYKEEILDLYVNKKKSCKYIAEQFEFSLSGVYDALKRWNICTRNLSDSHKIYTFNEEYFKK